MPTAMPTALPSPSPKLSVTLTDAVATVAIDNPDKRNAVDLDMWRAFPPLMTSLEADERIRGVILRGAGTGAFTSGADIAEFATVRADAAGGRSYEAANEAAFWAVAHCRKPVLAAIRGFCLGGGFGLALACDIRMAEEGATFAIPAARLGIGYPPGAMGLVVAALGPAAAKDLFFTARRIGAEEAQRLGVVQRVVPDSDLDAEAALLADAIAANAPLTITAAKAAINRAAGFGPSDLDPAALAEACFDSKDYREGRAAFLAKRSPVFTGR